MTKIMRVPYTNQLVLFALLEDCLSMMLHVVNNYIMDTLQKSKLIHNEVLTVKRITPGTSFCSRF